MSHVLFDCKITREIWNLLEVEVNDGKESCNAYHWLSKRLDSWPAKKLTMPAYGIDHIWLEGDSKYHCNLDVERIRQRAYAYLDMMERTLNHKTQSEDNRQWIPLVVVL